MCTVATTDDAKSKQALNLDIVFLKDSLHGVDKVVALKWLMHAGCLRQSAGATHHQTVEQLLQISWNCGSPSVALLGLVAFVDDLCPRWNRSPFF
jgi:hypothetical protein